MSYSISNYYRDIPANTFQEAVKGGTFQFLISTVSSGNLAYGMTKGGLIFLATLVHGAVSPLFQKFLNKNPQRNSYLEEVLKTSSVVVITGVLAKRMGYGYALNRITDSLLFNCILVGFNTDYRKINNTHPVVV